MRFDDINSRMNWDKFLVLKNVLEKYNIKSILGVVPNCKDHNLFFGKPAKNYNQRLLKYKLFGDTIAQHGFEHLYDSKQKGYFGSSRNSEFAGHSFGKQRSRLYKGKCFLEKLSLWEPVFMAPCHSFDENTLRALNKLGFKSISDGYGFFPYKKKGIDLVPQISSRPFNIGFGLSTICIHTNNLNKKNIKNFLEFISTNRSRIINYEEYINYKFPSKYINGSLNFLSRKIIRSYRLFKNYQI